MVKTVALLRGINVGGHRKVPMAELRELLKELGFTNVATYIQSGNIIFDTGDNINKNEVPRILENAILEKFGFDVPVIIRNAEEMQALPEKNPFYNNPEHSEEFLHVIFLSDIPSNEAIDTLSNLDVKPEEFKCIGSEIFLYCPEGVRNSKFTNNLFEKKLKLKATSRNWKTVNKLIEMAE